jgi:hypothetical protein
MQVGAGMTPDQDVSHMALWAVTACKLLISVDPRKFSPQALALVSNPEVIAIDQDPLKLQVSVFSLGLSIAAKEQHVHSGHLHDSARVARGLNRLCVCAHVCDLCRASA